MLALLAAECALKATLLHGYQLNTTEDAEESQRARWFRGTTGHRLQILWSDQPASQRQSAGPEDQAVCALNQADPYVYRYGGKRPNRGDAMPYVEHAETLVQWMKVVIGVAP
jgi:hypothetical protein